MPFLYESYVRTVDPARRTPVIPRVEEVGRTRKLSPGPYSHWWSFAVGLGVGFLLFTKLGHDMTVSAVRRGELVIRERI